MAALLIFAQFCPVPAAGILYAFAAHLCHQRPERSLSPVLGAAAGLCTVLRHLYGRGGWICCCHCTCLEERGLWRPSPRTLLLAGAAPTVMTVLMEWSGAWSGSNTARAAAGATLGLAVAFVVAQAAATLHYGECVRRRPIANNRPPTPI
jgi:H+/Cl- antiporter ClcA